MPSARNGGAEQYTMRRCVRWTGDRRNASRYRAGHSTRHDGAAGNSHDSRPRHDFAAGHFAAAGGSSRGPAAADHSANQSNVFDSPSQIVGENRSRFAATQSLSK